MAVFFVVPLFRLISFFPGLYAQKPGGQEGVKQIDYKRTRTLKGYVTELVKSLPSRITWH